LSTPAGAALAATATSVEDAAGRLEPSGIRKGYFLDDGSVADR